MGRGLQQAAQTATGFLVEGRKATEAVVTALGRSWRIRKLRWSGRWRLVASSTATTTRERALDIPALCCHAMTCMVVVAIVVDWRWSGVSN